jgi:hypothetical protein
VDGKCDSAVYGNELSEINQGNEWVLTPPCVSLIFAYSHFKREGAFSVREWSCQ